MQTTLNAQAIKIMKTFSLRSHASSSCHDVADAILHGKQGKVDTKHVISSQHGWPRSPRYVCIFASETTTFRKPKVARKGLVRHPFTLFPVIALMAFLSPLISPRARNIICLFSPSLPPLCPRGRQKAHQNWAKCISSKNHAGRAKLHDRAIVFALMGMPAAPPIFVERKSWYLLHLMDLPARLLKRTCTPRFCSGGAKPQFTVF